MLQASGQRAQALYTQTLLFSSSFFVFIVFPVLQ